MSGHSANPIFLNNKKKTGCPEHLLQPTPQCLITFHFGLTSPITSQTGQHMSVTPKLKAHKHITCTPHRKIFLTQIVITRKIIKMKIHEEMLLFSNLKLGNISYNVETYFTLIDLLIESV